jgi:hypothetical protein
VARTQPDTAVGPDPAELAAAVVEARRRLVGFVEACSEGQWASAPLADADPRTVATIVDHVADAYDYLAAWIDRLRRGDPAEVNSTVVDELNARHAAAAPAPTRPDVVAHLGRSGDAIVALISSLSPQQLAGEDAPVVRLAHIAARHADSHRDELEAVLGLSS